MIGELHYPSSNRNLSLALRFFLTSGVSVPVLTTHPKHIKMSWTPLFKIIASTKMATKGCQKSQCPIRQLLPLRCLWSLQRSNVPPSLRSICTEEQPHLLDAGQTASAYIKSGNSVHSKYAKNTQALHFDCAIYYPSTLTRVHCFSANGT